MTYYTKTDSVPRESIKFNYGSLFSLITRGDPNLNISNVIGIRAISSSSSFMICYVVMVAIAVAVAVVLIVVAVVLVVAVAAVVVVIIVVVVV